MSVGDMAGLAAYALLGVVLGGASFASLRLNTALYLGGGLWRPIALHLVRLGLLAAVLVLTARQGAGPLLAAAGGFALARPIAMRVLGRAP